ncbi:MAG: tRNA (guanosine(46)-N7)-methyltransferase TrmB [Verrucomicrobiaceae bacterium]|nr:MAG: tRNA (guanosine(46)-N7)-methyltransferase TrmB [Verrucomicrobiaceae bacterium]
MVEQGIPQCWLAPGAPPLEVDFGCHRGAFLTGMASAFPSRNFLGIEKQSARVEICNKRFVRLGLANAFAIRGEGGQALKEFLPDASASILHVSFPDPWPKRRHERRRVVTSGFLAEAARVLRPGGVLRLMTDDAAYFEQMRNLAAGGWVEILWDDGIERPATTFEKTFLALGKPPFRCALRPALQLPVRERA